MVEVQSDVHTFIIWKSKTLKIYHDEINHIESKFDKVFDKQSSQEDVFNNF